MTAVNPLEIIKKHGKAAVDRHLERIGHDPAAAGRIDGLRVTPEDQIDEVVSRRGKKYAKCHIPAQYKYWLGNDGSCTRGDRAFAGTDVMLDTEGQPMLDKRAEALG